MAILSLLVVLMVSFLSCGTMRYKDTSSTYTIGKQPPQRQLANTGEFCNWGWAGPKTFQCRGKTYVYGSTYCPSGAYENICCEDIYVESGRACSADNSIDTSLCCASGREQPQPRPQPQPIPPTSSDTGEFCNWGWVGAKFFQCRGKTYVYGSAYCSSGTYPNICCEDIYVESGRACWADESADTSFCCSQR